MKRGCTVYKRELYASVLPIESVGGYLCIVFGISKVLKDKGLESPEMLDVVIKSD